MPPKQRTFLTNAQKLQLKHFWSEHPDLQLLAVVDWVRERFGVSVGRATLYRIYHAPVETFAGKAQQKKNRRVKFPELEKDILAFYEENRRLGDSAALSDDALLRAAAELRAQHGISEKELKLSNGWLHRFKERHSLRAAPQTIGEQSMLLSGGSGGHIAAEVLQVKPKRKPRAPPRRKSARETQRNGVSSLETPPQTVVVDVIGSASRLQQPLATSTDLIPSTTDLATLNVPPAVIQPLTYLSAVASDSVAAVGFIRWELHSGMTHQSYFSVDNDGVSILRSASYQINVELQHTTPPTGTFPLIFKLWAGVEFLGQCESSIRTEGGRSLSVLQLECTLSAQTVIRVEYHAPGLLYSGSRLVLQLRSELT